MDSKTMIILLYKKNFEDFPVAEYYEYTKKAENYIYLLKKEQEGSIVITQEEKTRIQDFVAQAYNLQWHFAREKIYGFTPSVIDFFKCFNSFQAPFRKSCAKSET